ncbi:coatomer subunit beta'-2-like protein, partial [Tanacetum coccineum]
MVFRECFKALIVCTGNEEIVQNNGMGNLLEVIKSTPTIMLEVVASYDLWIWHAFFEVAGANNVLTVLNDSPLFDDLLDDIAPVAPSFSVANSEKNALFKRKQESARKDIERAFGVLQGRWHIICQSARAWTINKLRRGSTFEIKKTFDQKSERVKSIDLHPTEPWVLIGLYSGNVNIWNYHTQVTTKSFEIAKSPVRAAKFIANKEWIVCGADDGFIRVYNYNTMESVAELKAHTDFVRSFAVHPSLPYVLSASDDKTIKLWDWENGWECSKTFDGHEHYVMQVA